MGDAHHVAALSPPPGRDVVSVMSFIRRPEPQWSPCMMLLEEITDIWQILELLSTRLAALERDRLDNHPATRPERPSDGAG